MRQFLLLIFLCSIALSSWAQPLPTYRLERISGTPVDFPFGFAVDRNGSMFVLEMSGKINQLDRNGRFLQAIDATLGNTNSRPRAMEMDAAGNFYVLDNTCACVRKLSPTGQLLLQIGTSGSGPGQFTYPENLTVDAAGNVYVVDPSYGRYKVMKFNTNGVLQFEYTGTAPNALAEPMDVAVDAAGMVYVGNKNYSVIKLNPAGQFVQRINLPGGDQLEYLNVDASGNLYMCHLRSDQVEKYSPTGAYLSRLDGAVSSSSSPIVTFDAQGNIYLASPSHQTNSSRIRKYDPNGALLDRWGNVDRNTWVALDEAGNYYTFDLTTRKVSRYTPFGQRTLQFGTQGPANGQFQNEVSSVAVDGLGNIYTLEIGAPGRIQKFNPQGQFLAKYESFGNTPPDYYNVAALALDAAGNMYVWNYSGAGVRKLSPQGVSLGVFGATGIRDRRAFAVSPRGDVFIADYNAHRVRRFSGTTGQLQRTYGRLQLSDSSYISMVGAVAVDGADNVYFSSGNDGVTRIYKADGSAYREVPRGASRLAVNRRGTRLLTSHYYTEQVYLWVPTTAPPENLIVGAIFQDLNNNCTQEANEPPIPGVVTVAQPGNYYGVSDENGYYTLSVDTGTYAVSQLLPADEPGRVITSNCPPTGTVRVPAGAGGLPGPDFGNQVSTAPYLTVNVASDRRRRCFRNSTIVAYANTGFAPSGSAEVAVALPPQVIFISASVPHTRDAQGRYVFQVGTLAPQQRGSIHIVDSVACGNPSVTGLTVCTKAWITPGNTYLPRSGWDQSSIVVEGRSQANNQARFVLRNKGRGATADSLWLRIYQNTELALRHRFALPAGDSLVLRVPATGAVVRVEAEQAANHPFGRVAGRSVEMPGLRTPGTPSPAMAAFPPAADLPEAAEQCLPIRDSYDPNDKQVQPVGLTAQHYTPTGAALRYQIRFQNTGTDVAYRVEVVDTLDADLDLRTLHIGAASHPYRYTITGRQRPVLQFVFDHINLPDSTTNRAGSMGFVQFSISPKTGLADRTAVENNADIYFDYNPPVRTNTTINRIHDLPTVVTANPPLAYDDVIVSPAVHAVAPGRGRAGTLVTLTGRRFAATPADNRISFNGVAATALNATATSLTVRVPTGATPGKIRVQTPDGSAQSPADFVASLPPTLTTITPADATPGTMVTLTGTHFSALTHEDTVSFNGVAARVVQASATSLQVEVPAGATTGRVRVQTLGGGVESAAPFTVWYPPTITGISPSKGRAGTLLTLTGTNFAADASRNQSTVGQAAAVVQASPTTLRVRVPADAQSGPVRVQTPGGSAISATSFTFIPAPDIAAFTPETGTVGSVVTITGQHFRADNQSDTVYIGGVVARVLQATPTRMEVQVLRGAATGPVRVAGAGGQATSSRSFAVTELTPNEAITLYPNPTRGAFTVDWTKAGFEVQEVRIYNAVGSLVQQHGRSHLSSQDALTLALPPQGAGFYLVVIQTSRGAVVKRLSVL